MKVLDFLFYYLARMLEITDRRKKKTVSYPDQVSYAVSISTAVWIVVIDGIIEYYLFDSFVSKIPFQKQKFRGFEIMKSAKTFLSNSHNNSRPPANANCFSAKRRDIKEPTDAHGALSTAHLESASALNGEERKYQ